MMTGKLTEDRAGEEAAPTSGGSGKTESGSTPGRPSCWSAGYPVRRSTLSLTTRLMLCLLMASCALNRPAQPTAGARFVGDPPPCQEATRQAGVPRPAKERVRPSERLMAPATPESPFEDGPFDLGVTPLRVDLPAPDTYYAEVRRLIKARMVYPREAARRQESGTVVLRFELAKDGSVRCISIDRSSGIAVLDRAAVDAVRDATLPSLPEGLGDHLSLTGNFNYVLQAPAFAPAQP